MKYWLTVGLVCAAIAALVVGVDEFVLKDAAPTPTFRPASGGNTSGSGFSF